jgi:hypothetical protein
MNPSKSRGPGTSLSSYQRVPALWTQAVCSTKMAAGSLSARQWCGNSERSCKLYGIFFLDLTPIACVVRPSGRHCTAYIYKWGPRRRVQEARATMRALLALGQRTSGTRCSFLYWFCIHLCTLTVKLGVRHAWLFQDRALTFIDSGPRLCVLQNCENL